MGRSKFGSFLRDFTSAYAVTNGLVRDFAMGQAANVKPEESESTTLNETTPDRENMVYDSDTGQYLPKYLGKDGQPTERTQAQLNTPADGASEAPDGVLPSFTAKTSKSYKMGNKVQDTPFSQEQVDAQRFRNQADVSSRFGNFREAAALQGLSKAREKDAMVSAADQATRSGMTTIAQDASAQEKEYKRMNIRYEALVNAGLYDEASSTFGQMEKAREGFIKHSRDRADNIYATTGSLAGHIDNNNNLFANGRVISRYKQNPEGSLTVYEINGKALDQPLTIPKDELFSRVDDKGEYRPGWIDKVYDPGVHREFATKFMQAGALKRQESKIAEDTPSKMAATDKDKATAEYYRGAKTVAAQAQAEAAQARAKGAGAGSGLGQQRFDAQQAHAFKKELSPLISFPNNMTQKMEVSVDGDYLATALIGKGYPPEFIQDRLYQLRAENPDAKQFSAAARKVVAALRAPPAAPAAPAATKVQPIPSGGLERQPAQPSATVAPPPSQGKMIRRGQPYMAVTSIPDGKGGFMQAPQEVEEVINIATGEVTTRPVSGLSRAISARGQR